MMMKWLGKWQKWPYLINYLRGCFRPASHYQYRHHLPLYACLSAIWWPMWKISTYYLFIQILSGWECIDFNKWRTWCNMKLCPWNMTLIHSVSPYTTGSETCHILSPPTKTTDQGRKTNLYLLHKPVVASFFELPTNCKVMKVMGAFVAFRKSPQFLQLFLADSPASFAKEVILKWIW